MNKQLLFESAQQLKPPKPEAVHEYENKRGALVAKVNEIMLNHQDLSKMISRNHIEMMKDNHENHAKFMVSIFNVFNAEVLVETILWAFRAYKNRGFSSTYWAAQLDTWTTVLGKELSEESFKEIYPFYQWMQVNIPVFTDIAQQNTNSPFATY